MMNLTKAGNRHHLLATLHRYKDEAPPRPQYPEFDPVQHGSDSLRRAMRIPEHLLGEDGKLSIAKALEAESEAYPAYEVLDRLLTLHPIVDEDDWPDDEYDRRKEISV